MAGRLEDLIGGALHRRVLRRWGKLAELAPTEELDKLRANRTKARALRRNLDRVIHEADHRLALPVIGSNVMRKPMGTDWSWRPNLWKGPIPVPGFASVPGKMQIAEGAPLAFKAATKKQPAVTPEDPRVPQLRAKLGITENPDDTKYDAKVAAALADVKAQSSYFKVVGSYPAAVV